MISYDVTCLMNRFINLEYLQYDDALAMARAIRGSNTEKLYQELSLEYLHNRRMLRRFCSFCKISNPSIKPHPIFMTVYSYHCQ